MMWQKKIIIALIASLFPLLTIAEVIPQSYPSDKHIQVVSFSPNQVYRVTGMQGYTTAIELGSDEKIISVNVGDSSAWLVNVQDNVINVKPVTDYPSTNMNVVTSRGSYQFFLTAPPVKHDASGKMARTPNANTVFLLRFRYPDDNAASPYKGLMPHANNNINYTARGSKTIAPNKVFDDGRFTYFDFGDRQNIPAIFAVDNKGNESLVNYHMQGKYVVVEIISPQFTLRDGNQVASIFNEAAAS